jgi:hypothetical protein
VGAVIQVVDGGSRLLHGFPEELGPSFQLRMELYSQVVVTIAMLKRLSNLFVDHSSRDAM